MHVADGPVGVVRERVDGLDRHHRPLEGRHAVERQRDDHELQDRIGAQLMPGARQGHDAVDHAAPARCQQDQREHHAERLRPVRQRRVVQVMRAGPHVDRDQRPEMDDRQPVRIDRALRLLGHVVVHDAEEAGSQEETDRIVSVPPLHHRVDRARVDRIGLGPRYRHGQVVEDVQDRDGQDVGAKEPVGDVDVADAALGDGAEEDHRIGDPDRGDQDVDRPDQLGVFMALGQAHRQGDRGGDDDRLPAPERERREPIGEQAHMAGALDHVVRGREQAAAAEGEDHRIGVQRPQAAVAEPGDVEIQRRPGELGGDEQSDQHADHAPYHGGDRELADDFVVVGFHSLHTIPIVSGMADSGGAADTAR